MSPTTPIPTQGTLRASTGEALPLERTDVRGRVDGPIASLEVRQRFHNDTGRAIEAVYAFPLPAGAAVHRMRFVIRDRVVEAVVRGREAARALYERARAAGRAATLLEEDRPSLFTLSVANVPAGETVEVELEYQEVLAYDDGRHRLVFPMVAPVRYHEVPPAAGERRPPRRPLDTRAADVSIELEVRGEPDDALEPLRCTSHRVDVEDLGSGRRRVRLHASETVPNRDFVLMLGAARAGVRPQVRFERAPDASGTFLLTLTPSSDLDVATDRGGRGDLRALSCGNCGALVDDVAKITEIPGLGAVVPCAFCGAVLAPSPEGAVVTARRPRDVVVLIDRSASMRGCIPQARRAVRALLEGLAPGDGLQLLGFDHERVPFDGDGRGWVALSPEVVQRAERFVGALTPRGGSELLAAVERAGELPRREGRTKIVVLVTDAAVGNEGHLLRKLPGALGGARLFVLGLGATVDRRLVERMARVGGGASDALGPHEDVEPVLARFARRVRGGGPILTGLSLSWEGARVRDLHPSPVPDLYGGEPIRVLGRYDGVGDSRLVITGATADGRPFRQEVPVRLPARSDQTPGLERLWARRRIDALIDRIDREPGQARPLEREATELALAHGVVCRFTSLVADDDEVVGDGEPERVIAQAGAPPDGALEPCEMDDEGSFGEMAAALEVTRSGGARPACAPAPASTMRVFADVTDAPASAKRGSRGVLSRAGAAVADMIGRRAPRPPRTLDVTSETWGGAAWQPTSEPPGSDAYDADELRWLAGRASGELDLVFLVDETGSMGPYIDQVKAHLLELIDALKRSPLCTSLRLGLVTYRDHPPQDHTFASRVVELTDDTRAIRRAVRAMRASGGGDGPESVTDGLFDLVRLAWRPGAARAVVWFGDAPPHGVEPLGDGFPRGCPCGHHWYTQAESCAEMGVAIYAVGCRPGIQSYVGAEEVFRTVARATRGSYLPITRAEMLIPLIVGAAASELDRQRVDAHVREVVVAHAEALAGTDEAERIRWVTDVLREGGVRPRDMGDAYDADTASPTPLRFRAMSEADVAGALGRLRGSGRASI